LTEVPKIQVADIPTTINNVPGYSAQQATVQTQGFFTLHIGILVIGGFFQIQVLQKVSQIGVLGHRIINAASEGCRDQISWLPRSVGTRDYADVPVLLRFPPTVPLAFNEARCALTVAS
jgi:putative ABC transport system permease protein